MKHKPALLTQLEIAFELLQTHPKKKDPEFRDELEKMRVVIKKEKDAVMFPRLYKNQDELRGEQ